MSRRRVVHGVGLRPNCLKVAPVYAVLSRRRSVPERLSRGGITIIDTLRANEDAARSLAASLEFGLERGRYVLVTLHRPSLVDHAGLLAETIAGLDEVAETLPVLFPVHPRTRRNLT